MRRPTASPALTGSRERLVKAVRDYPAGPARVVAFVDGIGDLSEKLACSSGEPAP